MKKVNSVPELIEILLKDPLSNNWYYHSEPGGTMFSMQSFMLTDKSSLKDMKNYVTNGLYYEPIKVD